MNLYYDQSTYSKKITFIHSRLLQMYNIIICPSSTIEEKSASQNNFTFSFYFNNETFEQIRLDEVKTSQCT